MENLYEKINIKEDVNWTTSERGRCIDGHIANGSDNLSFDSIDSHDF